MQDFKKWIGSVVLGQNHSDKIFEAVSADFSCKTLKKLVGSVVLGPNHSDKVFWGKIWVFV